jgi:hypothetical protein
MDELVTNLLLYVQAQRNTTESMISTLQGLKGEYTEEGWTVEDDRVDDSWDDSWDGAYPAGTTSGPSTAVTYLSMASQDWQMGHSYSSGSNYGYYYAAMLTNSW